jgi:hypothetical protein
MPHCCDFALNGPLRAGSLIPGGWRALRPRAPCDVAAASAVPRPEPRLRWLSCLSISTMIVQARSSWLTLDRAAVRVIATRTARMLAGSGVLGHSKGGATSWSRLPPWGRSPEPIKSDQAQSRSMARHAPSARAPHVHLSQDSSCGIAYVHGDSWCSGPLRTALPRSGYCQETRDWLSPSGAV